MSLFEVIFLVLLVDSFCAVLAGWTPLGVHFREMALFKRYMPLTRAWTLWYFTLVMFIGYLIYYV